jgi:hypothetical protein
MAVALATPTNGNYNTSTDATSHTTASISFVKGRLYLVQVMNTGSAGNATLPTMSTSASGVTFAQVSTQISALTTIRSTVFRFIVGADTSGTLTADWAGVTQTSCIIFVSEVTGHLQGGNGEYAIRNLQGAVLNTLLNTFSATMGAFAKPTNATFAVFSKQNSEDVTVTGVTEVLDQTTATPTRSYTNGFLATNVATPTFSWTTTNNNGNIIAFEIVEQDKFLSSLGAGT